MTTIHLPDTTYFNLPRAGGVAHTLHPEQSRVFRNHPGPNGGWFLRDPGNPDHLREDWSLVDKGILDPASAMSGYIEQIDPLQIYVHDSDGAIKHIRYSHNLRINYGGQLLMKMLQAADGTGTTNTPFAYYDNSATITYTATSVTPGTSPSWTTNMFQDHLVVPWAQGVYGVVVSNSATALTVDRWISIAVKTLTNPVTGAAGTTPANNTSYVILPGGSPLLWLAVSTDATAPNTTDSSMAGEVTTNGFARAFCGGAATAYSTVTTNPTGSSTSTNQTATCKVHNVFTATGTLTSIQKAGLFNVAGASTGNPSFEATYTLFGVNTNDTATYDWSIQNT